MGKFLIDIKLAGKTAIITGATKGIGRATAIALHQVGANVIALGRNQKELLSLKKKLKKRIKIFKCDMNDYDNLKKIVMKQKKIDILVNNAGTNLPEPFLKVKQSSLNTLLDVNTKSAFNMAKLCVDKMLKHNFTNAMNFEHTYMLSEDMIQNIMSYSNLEIISIKPFSEYINFYIVKKTNNQYIIKHDYSGQANIINKFCYFYESEVERIKNQLDSIKENNFIFGAHIFTQYLLSFGLDQGMFKNVLDNDPNKQNNRLYGTSLLVNSPQILKDIKNPVVILKAAMYTEEIKNDIINNINPKTRFIL